MRWAGLVVGALLLSGCDDEVCDWDGNVHEDDTTNELAGTCVPEGQRFDEVYVCDDVGGPCPKSDERGAKARVSNDPTRVSDPDLDWVNQQIVACGCSCCHRAGRVSAHRWSIDFQPVWIESADNQALEALIAADGDTMDPSAQNGFHQQNTHLPTTDGPRMRAYLERELARR